MIVAVLSLVFSVLFIWFSSNTGHSFWVYWAPFFLAGGALLLGIPVYASQRHHLTEVPRDAVDLDHRRGAHGWTRAIAAIPARSFVSRRAATVRR